MSSESPPVPVLLLLAVLARERENAQHEAALARRRCERAQLDVGWKTAAVLGEAAAETFCARGVAVRLARAIAAHRAAILKPRTADVALWAALDQTWQGIDSDWQLVVPVVEP